jgi:hypothetical protein
VFFSVVAAGSTEPPLDNIIRHQVWCHTAVRTNISASQLVGAFRHACRCEDTGIFKPTKRAYQWPPSEVMKARLCASYLVGMAIVLYA